ncbi:MFS transporter [Candidatus Bathyarchaeota archaeon]|nr:MFS transporter [Candidatus Bathyarchaeota archaeon]
MQVVSGIRQYMKRLGTLSSNARLFLVATILQGLSFGIWGVIFSLYLNLPDVGFQLDFIGNVFSAGAIATGFAALPAGLLCERIGSKRALLLGLMANFISLVQIIVLEPSILLVASLSSGLIGTIGWVASAPFMTENSKAEERTYLFSVNWASMIILGVVGSYVGGILPDMFNSLLDLSTGPVAGSPVGYRITLGISVILALAAAFPILLVKEQRPLKSQRMADYLALRNIRSHRLILKLMIPTGLIGFGAGFIVPLLNNFFQAKFLATTEQIGIISALGSITLGIGTLAAPLLSSRLGKVKSIVACQYSSMPFILLITSAPNLAMSSLAYVARGALMNMAGPISSALQMELVGEAERATTNGLMVMADNVPRAITASVSGEMMTGSDFFTPFLFTTVTYFVASSIYFIFFKGVEAKADFQDKKL